MIDFIAFTCPRCSTTSEHKEQAEAGYCRTCGDWTRVMTCPSTAAIQPKYIGVFTEDVPLRTEVL